jgi:hypothetical protein
MDSFVRKHQKKINGTLSCFDRMIFRGYLPIQSGWQMAQFLSQNTIHFRHVKDFLVENADKINKHAKAMADKYGRPIQYLAKSIRMEDQARKMAEEEG